MTTTATHPTADHDPAPTVYAPTRPRTSGWLLFAATVTFLAAAANLLYGLALIAGDDWIVLTPEQLIRFNSNAVGTMYLLFGGVQLVVGYGILGGRLWARVLGIAGAGLNALAQMTFLSAYPAWSITVMVVDLLVIYALTVHGDEVAPL
ncbi:MAG: hypothetical protein S0880_14105 [Actinomycetota bacterium]|nr:hypothetical protein [Actinomycetota bacterium]